MNEPAMTTGAEGGAAPSPPAGGAPVGAPALAGPSPPLPFVHASGGGADLLAQFGLGDMLDNFRRRLAKNTLRTTFLHYVTDLPVELDGARAGVPLRPRCRAGSLMEIARAPVNEDVRVLEEFDERVLRDALTMREGPDKIPMPAWLEFEQKLGSDDRRRRKERERERRKKKKKRRSGKRKRDGEEDPGAALVGDMEADAKKKKKKRRKDSDGVPSAS